MGKLVIDPRILLLQRAGITDELLEAGEVDQQFSFILEALESIHRGKEALYGNYLKTHGDEPELFALLQHFCDLKRKYVRAETFIKKRADGVEISYLEMLDTYADLAVYGAMGVQLILHLLTRGKNANVSKNIDTEPVSSQSAGGGGKTGARDYGAPGERPGPSIFARPAGNGPAEQPGANLDLSGSSGPSGDEALRVTQEATQKIADRIKSQALGTSAWGAS